MAKEAGTCRELCDRDQLIFEKGGIAQDLAEACVRLTSATAFVQGLGNLRHWRAR